MVLSYRSFLYWLGGELRDTPALLVASTAAAWLGLRRDLKRHSRRRFLLRADWSS